MAGSITETANNLGTIKTIEFACTADAAAATFPNTALTQKIDGFLLAIETNPGATAPTDQYDITIEDEEGLDQLQGTGANRATATTEIASVVVGTYFHPPVTQDMTLTLKIANNSVNSALIKIILYWSPASG